MFCISLGIKFKADTYSAAVSWQEPIRMEVYKF